MEKPTKGVTRRQFLGFLGKFLLISGIFGLFRHKVDILEEVDGPFYGDFGTAKSSTLINEHLAQNLYHNYPPPTIEWLKVFANLEA